MSKGKLKILIIGPMPPPPGGVSMHLSRLLARHGKNEQVSLQVLDVRQRRLYSSAGSTTNWFAILFAWLLADVIHLHISKPVKLKLAKLAKAFGKKVIYTHHNTRNLDEMATREVMQLSDKVILVQEPVDFPFTDTSDKFTVIPAFIPPLHTARPPEWFTQEQQKYPDVLLSLCYHEPGKPTLIEGRDLYGFDLILDALEKIAEHRSLRSFMLILVDPNGTMRTTYSSRLQELERKTSMRMLYRFSPEDVSSLLPYCRLFLRTTLSDGDSLSVREALAVGIPVLASDCSTRPQGVVLFRSGDGDDLEAKLSAILENPYRIAFSQPDFSEELIQLYVSFC